MSELPGKSEPEGVSLGLLLGKMDKRIAELEIERYALRDLVMRARSVLHGYAPAADLCRDIDKAVGRTGTAQLEAERDALLTAAKRVMDVVDGVMHPDAAHSEVSEVDLCLCEIQGILSRAIAKTEGREVSDE